MKLEDMKRITEDLVMCANNWDKLMAVVEAAKKFHAQYTKINNINFEVGLSHELGKALEELENE